MWLVELENFPLVQSTAHLPSLTTKKSSLHQAIHSDKKIETILLTEWEKGSGKLYYGKPHLVYMQCSYAMLTNAEHQHATTVQTYNITTGTVCT